MNTIPLPAHLLTRREDLRQTRPEDQSIAYHAARWVDAIDAADLAAITTMSGTVITRAHLASLAHIALDDPGKLRQLFVATMIWGFGTVGYGPYRTRRMLASLDGTSMLEMTAEYLTAGRIDEAYRTFRADMCSPAFFTKFFYAVGLGLRSDPMPLVLDSRVAASLRPILAETGGDVGQYIRGKSTVVWYPAGYVRYVELLHHWAQELGCRPDAIEMFLFNNRMQ